MMPTSFAAPFAGNERERLQSTLTAAWIVQHVAMAVLGLLLFLMLAAPFLVLAAQRVPWEPKQALFVALPLLPLVLLAYGIRGLVRRPGPLPENVFEIADGQITLLGRRFRRDTLPVAEVTPSLATWLGEPAIRFDTPKGARHVQLRMLAEPQAALVALGLAPR